MAVQQMHHVSIVVDDLDAAAAFFERLGLAEEGRTGVAGPWADAVNGIDGIRVDIVMMRTPDGHGRVELTKFHAPPVRDPEPRDAPPNTMGLRSVMFAVDDIEAAVEALRPVGGELIGEIARYEDVYKLCYLRGPGGSIIALAEELG